MEIKRYHIVTGTQPGLSWMEESERGFYVKYSDHIKAMKDLVDEMISGFNYNLIHGGALNETPSKKTDK